MRVYIKKTGQKGSIQGEFENEQQARDAMVNDPTIESIRVFGLPLGDTEWELTRNLNYIRRNAGAPDKNGIARIGWSNCD